MDDIFSGDSSLSAEGSPTPPSLSPIIYPSFDHNIFPLPQQRHVTPTLDPRIPRSPVVANTEPAHAEPAPADPPLFAPGSPGLDSRPQWCSPLPTPEQIYGQALPRFSPYSGRPSTSSSDRVTRATAASYFRTPNPYRPFTQCPLIMALPYWQDAKGRMWPVLDLEE